MPREVLIGVGFAETHLDGHRGAPSQANGYGVMHLVSNNLNPTMSEASKLTGLKNRSDLGTWYSVIAKYSHSADAATAQLYTAEVYKVIGLGVRTAGVVRRRSPRS